MLQLDFLFEILKRCKESGIHTAVDTAGHIPWEYFEKIIPHTDLFLYDVKSMDNDIHKKYTGVENTLILENLAKLLKANIHLWIRVPIISGINDNVMEMKKIKTFLTENGIPDKVELLPYHAMGEHKYIALGRETEEFNIPEKCRLDELNEVFCHISE